MNKEEKLLFLNKQLKFNNSEKETYYGIFNYFEGVPHEDIPWFYLDFNQVKDEIIESLESKEIWLKEKIQEIEAE